MATHPNRKSIRLQGYDCSQAGMYSITICTHERLCTFGDIVEGNMQLNEMGRTAWDYWAAIPSHFKHAELDVFVVMPNHIHGIIVLNGSRGAACCTPTDQSKQQNGKLIAGSISAIVRSYKSAVTRRINQDNKPSLLRVWQRGYYDHIIRNNADYDRIATYILNNPLKWQLDSLYQSSP